MPEGGRRSLPRGADRDPPKSARAHLSFYEEMDNEEILRAKAKAALQSGKVPPRKPDRRFGGLGTGKDCAVCGEVMTLTQMEIELEFKRQSPEPGLDTYRAHPRCFAALELELDDLRLASAPSSSARISCPRPSGAGRGRP